MQMEIVLKENRDCYIVVAEIEIFTNEKEREKLIEKVVIVLLSGRARFEGSATSTSPSSSSSFRIKQSSK